MKLVTPNRLERRAALRGQGEVLNNDRSIGNLASITRVSNIKESFCFLLFISISYVRQDIITKKKPDVIIPQYPEIDFHG